MNGEIIEKVNVYEKLREEILYMELAPGQVIGEIETASRFCVSRTPVREAFKKLQRDGLLEIKSHVGTVVTLIDLAEITNILYMREKLELAIISDVMNAITKAQELRLHMILSKQKQLFDKGYSGKELAKAFILNDNEFHQTLFEIAGRKSVWDFLCSLEHHYERLRMFLNLMDDEMLYRLYEDHRKILEAIQSQNIEEVQKLYSKHLYEGIMHGTKKINENLQYFADFS